MTENASQLDNQTGGTTPHEPLRLHEVIVRLVKLWEKHGNAPVHIWEDHEKSGWFLSAITGVEYDQYEDGGPMFVQIQARYIDDEDVNSGTGTKVQEKRRADAAEAKLAETTAQRDEANRDIAQLQAMVHSEHIRAEKAERDLSILRDSEAIERTHMRLERERDEARERIAAALVITNRYDPGLFPLGHIRAALTGPAPVTDREEPAQGDVIKCQQCGQQSRSISRGCSNCGLGRPAASEEPAGETKPRVFMLHDVSMPDCLYQERDGAVYCSEDGHCWDYRASTPEFRAWVTKHTHGLPVERQADSEAQR